MALYGRRRRRRLRAGRRALLAERLPEIAVRVPYSGRIADPWAEFGIERAAPLWLEIGFGAGEHLAWQAAHRRDAAIVGCEAFVDGVAGLLARVAAEGLANVRIFPDDARTLVAALPDSCLARVFILFPDPWPKARHRKRRLVSAAFLDDLARTMRAGAELRIATDHAGLRDWMLARLLAHRRFAWTAREAADWRRRPADWPETRYERKARAAGRACAYLRFVRRGVRRPCGAADIAYIGGGDT